MPTTTTPTALEALDQLDHVAIKVGRRMQEVNLLWESVARVSSVPSGVA